MPHLTLEYTANLHFEVQSLLQRLHAELVASGAVNLKGLKSRAVRHSDYWIADGNGDYAFAHVGLLIREGRSPEVQQDIVQRMMAVLKEVLGDRFENGYPSLSVDIKEMRAGTALTFHNIPAADSDAGDRPDAAKHLETEQGKD